MWIAVPRQPTARLSDARRHRVGTGRFDLALRRDYQDSLDLVQRKIGFRYIRGHGLLSDGMGVHRPYDYAGEWRVRHVFTYVDQVVDAYLEMGTAPFLGLGFMPSGLASGDDTVFWWKDNVTPPRDEKEWADLVRAVIGHLVDRYGIDQVRQWPIEVWNEPNLAPFWAADQDAYHRLYEVTSLAVKDDRRRTPGRRPLTGARLRGRVDPALRRVRRGPRPADRLREPPRLLLRPRPARAVRRSPDAHAGVRAAGAVRRPAAAAGGHRAGGPAAPHHRVQLLVPTGQPDPRHRVPRGVPCAGAGERR